MEILNQAMEFTQQYSLFFLAGMFAVIFDSCDLHDCYEQQNERIAGSI